MERSQNKEAGPTDVEDSRGVGQTDLQLGTPLKLSISFFLIENFLCSCWLQNSMILIIEFCGSTVFKKNIRTTKLSTSFISASFSPLPIFFGGGGVNYLFYNYVEYEKRL